MAEADLKLAYDAVRGVRSTYVYRHQNGKTFFYRRRPPGNESPAVLEVRRKFRLGAAYASAVLADPVQLAPYEAIAAGRREPLRQVIMTDYLKAPTVDRIDLSGFDGLAGSPIRIEAHDDCGVTEVTVSIRAEDNTLIEEGPAVYNPVKLVWEYLVTQPHPGGIPVTITATAVDRPGNRGTGSGRWGPAPSE
jgi:hypothetical protein